MVLNGNDFLAQLLETFRGEAQEHLSEIAAGLLILEKSGVSPEEYHATVEQVFRETHSLKGAARAVGLRDIELLCQHQESVFSAVKKGTLTLEPVTFDLFHEVIHTLEKLLDNTPGVKIADLIQKLRSLSLSAGVARPVAGSGEQSGDLIPTLDPSLPETDILPPESTKTESKIRTSVISSDVTESVIPQSSLLVTPPPVQEPNIPIPDPSSPIPDAPVSSHQKGGTMVKISSDRLENLFARADDLMGARLAAGQRSSSLRDLLQNFMSWRWTWSQITTDIERLRTDSQKLNGGRSLSAPAEIERITNFLEYNRAFIRNLETDITAITRSAVRDQYLLDTATTELIDEIKQVILVPASSILDILPRAARDIARESGKDVDVGISGAELEIDRRILEGIRDPLLHIVRNCIDHGIELQETRVQKGKKPRGRISISVSHARGHQAEIQIADDGAGIDIQSVKNAARIKGVVTDEELNRMDNNQIKRLIFKSGLSTSRSVTTVSGRGLGLAIVQDKVDQIGGTVRIESSTDGTTFILTLPLTLATFRGVRVIVNRHPYFLPLRSIVRVMQIFEQDLKTIENRTVIELNDEPIAVVSLAKVLGLPEDTNKGTGTRQLVLINASGISFGLLVDQISGAQEIVVKDLGQQLRRVRHISGASILGDGVIVPVINCEDLAATIAGMEHLTPAVMPHMTKDVQKSILVTEDSITSRMLLKNILEGAGYLVETAVDGVDALTKLKVKTVDLVVSDVDMPRMNGFVLTEKIRADPQFADLPVILVTSLDSREDREHGILVGANAYIVKSSFDQSNLLEVISRHIL